MKAEALQKVFRSSLPFPLPLHRTIHSPIPLPPIIPSRPILTTTDWIFNNRVFTLLGFENIPPFASNCELRVSLPPEHLIWQTAISTTGTVLTGYNPSLFILPLRLSLSTSSTWTWNAFVAAEPTDAAVQYPLDNGAFFADGSIEVILPMGQCPGPSGPSGGVVGYAFAIANDIPYASASVFMNMEYGGSDLFGVYLQYTS